MYKNTSFCVLQTQSEENCCEIKATKPVNYKAVHIVAASQHPGYYFAYLEAHAVIYTMCPKV